GERTRMPGESEIKVVEGAGAGHEDLAIEGLLGGAAVVANRRGRARVLQPRLEDARRGERGGSEQVVAAAMTSAAGFERFLGVLDLLGESRQGVVLAEEPDHRAALALRPFGHEGGRHATDV